MFIDARQLTNGRVVEAAIAIVGGRGAGYIMPVTNAIESLNSTLRRPARARGHFPSDEAATKLIWLQLRGITKDWKMPAR